MGNWLPAGIRILLAALAIVVGVAAPGGWLLLVVAVIVPTRWPPSVSVSVSPLFPQSPPAAAARSRVLWGRETSCESLPLAGASFTACSFFRSWQMNDAAAKAPLVPVLRRWRPG